MKELLRDYMARFTDLPLDRLEDILADIDVRHYPKGTHLLEPDQVPRYCYFVLKGCVREYKIDQSGLESTLEFYTEEDALAAMTTYDDIHPADFYWTCVEDCVLVVGDLNQEEIMFDKHPGLERMVLKMVEDNFGRVQKRHAMLLTKSVEERYIYLEDNRSDLFNRVPQHQIASYLGVAPESLSRIKKRIYKSKLKMIK